MTLDLGPAAAADAVLYEGYLLYPYRSTAAKNQVRWQFGVLGPPGAAAAGLGEEPDLAVECLLRAGRRRAGHVHLRFLQLQRRQAQRAGGRRLDDVAELRAGADAGPPGTRRSRSSASSGTFAVAELHRGVHRSCGSTAARRWRTCRGGRLVRRRWPVRAGVTLSGRGRSGARLRIAVRNGGGRATDKDAALRSSLIGTHLLWPPRRPASSRSSTRRRTPGRRPDGAGSTGAGRSSPATGRRTGRPRRRPGAPIILYDHPAVAPESAVAMFDSTEIDEILTLRVLTLTDEEKAQARATDPRAAAIIDRCEQLTPEELQRLHGTLRDPHGAGAHAAGDDWWAAEAAAAVSPDTDAVLVGGVPVARGSPSACGPSRRADAQDMFLAGRQARVSAVQVDLDGATHVAVTLLDDPAAELHDWYGRYLYFAPDELEPLAAADA